jgi:hypothetical protein
MTLKDKDQKYFQLILDTVQDTGTEILEKLIGKDIERREDYLTYFSDTFFAFLDVDELANKYEYNDFDGLTKWEIVFECQKIIDLFVQEICNQSIDDSNYYSEDSVDENGDYECIERELEEALELIRNMKFKYDAIAAIAKFRIFTALNPDLGHVA